MRRRRGWAACAAGDPGCFLDLGTSLVTGPGDWSQKGFELPIQRALWPSDRSQLRQFRPLAVTFEAVFCAILRLFHATSCGLISQICRLVHKYAVSRVLRAQKLPQRWVALFPPEKGMPTRGARLWNPSARSTVQVRGAALDSEGRGPVHASEGSDEDRDHLLPDLWRVGRCGHRARH